MQQQETKGRWRPGRLAQSAGWVAVLIALVGMAGCGGGEDGTATAQGVPPEVTPAVASQARIASAAHQRLARRPARVAEVDAEYRSAVLIQAVPDGVVATAAEVVSLGDEKLSSLPSLALNGELLWKPVAADAGHHVFLARVWFSDGKVAERPFEVTVGTWLPVLDAELSAASPRACVGRQVVCAEIAKPVPIGKSARVVVEVFPTTQGPWVIRKRVTGSLPARRIHFTVDEAALRSLVPTPVAARSPAVQEVALPERVQQVSRADAVPELIPVDEPALPELTRQIAAWTGYELQIPNVQGGNFGLDEIAVSGAGPVTAYTGTQGMTLEEVARLHGSCGAGTTCPTHTAEKPPLLLIHGFNADCKFGGGEGTYGRLDTFARQNLGVSVFEFKWRTCMRFSEAAALLGEAAGRVQAMTGVAPVIVAHSFGGVVASTYLKGKAVAPVWDTTDGYLYDVARPYAASGSGAVSHLVTVGSPLSGIAKAPYRWPGTPYRMTQGRDSSDWTIGRCQQITCKEAGSYFGENRQFGPFYANGQNLAQDVWMGFNMYGLPGEAIRQLQSAAYPVATTVLVGDRWGPGVKGYSATTKACALGDGLISVAGQSIRPSDLFPTGADPYAAATHCAVRIQPPA